jgi:hypothetical protein
MSKGRQIFINDQKPIVNLQEEFNKVFPYLRIEFHIRGNTHTEFPRPPVRYLKKTFGDYRPENPAAEFCITPETTVFELDNNFRHSYGFGVQIFRKSGKAWLETTMTEAWTLDEQNTQGRELSA